MREKEIRRQRLLDLLPEHGWNVVKAGIAAGYSPVYCEKRLPEIIRHDDEFCRAILAKRQAIEATTADKRENALAKLQSIADDPKARHSDVIRAIEVMGRISGWMSETRVLEIPSRERELSEQNRRAAISFSNWYFDTTRALPATCASNETGDTASGKEEPPEGLAAAER